jgi:hypothetical protein
MVRVSVHADTSCFSTCSARIGMNQVLDSTFRAEVAALDVSLENAADTTHGVVARLHLPQLRLCCGSSFAATTTRLSFLIAILSATLMPSRN